jgi:glycosyltransferase involved in cell wall biosynthesis
MRVVYLCADLGIPLGGTKGAAVHVRSVIRALAAQGHELVVLTAAAGETISLEVPVIPIRGSDLAGEIAGGPDPRTARALAHLWNNVAAEAALREVATWFRPELIYERYAPFGVAGSLVARRLGIPHVLEVNAPLAWEGERYRRQALAEAAQTLEGAAFATTSRIVAVSTELKAILVSQGVSPGKIDVVPNGVDVELFDPSGDAWTEAGSGQIVVGFVGSLKPWHGIKLLVESFRSAAAARPDLHLLVVGDGPEARHVDALAAELVGRVTRVAGVPHAEVPRYLRGMAVAVAPYMPLERFYYSPLKVLEYMAAGRAVVASGLGQVTALLCHEETALLVPPGDAGALTEALLRLADDPDLRGRLGAAARREAGRHGWESRATDILAVVRAAA